MHQGLPQESVLAPLLFIFYINSLADILPSNNLNCMFADDVGIVATACDRNEAVASAQAGVDFVAEHLLGVTLDKGLTFEMPVSEVSKAAAKSCSMLSALAHSNYGWRKQYLVTVYHAMVSKDVLCRTMVAGEYMPSWKAGCGPKQSDKDHHWTVQGCPS